MSDTCSASRHADLIIRGGTILDGSGGDARIGDVAVVEDVIVAVGALQDWIAPTEIDATGLLVTPGFVDIHTHYDGQVIWEDRLVPSSLHGVTTVVMGNCGVGFAPCREQDRDRLIRLMEGIEDIPEVVITEGLTWQWESYPEYLDCVEARPHDLNIASLLPHSAVRVFVMGDRAATDAATAEDLALMDRVTREAIAAGALGFGTSRTIYHRSSDGDCVPTLAAEEAELMTVATVMKESGGGVMEIATTYDEGTSIAQELALMERLSRTTGQTVMAPTVQMHTKPQDWLQVLKEIATATARGARILGQVTPRGVGMLLGLDLSMHPFSLSPTYREMAHMTPAERRARLRDPAIAQQVINEAPIETTQPIMAQLRNFDNMFEMGAVPNYEPAPDDSIGARARRIGIPPEALAFDILMRDGKANTIFMPFSNYADGNLDAALVMLQDPNCVLGLGDGGAHCGMICDASYPTFMLTHWVRDRSRGERLPLPFVIKALSHATATAVGLEDRGLIAPGYRADINVIDHEMLTLEAPEITFDLPAGGRRLSQKAKGYVATLVNGQVVYRHGEPTGALPGRLVRGRQPQPAPTMQASHV